jgi:chromosome partitioning protein
MGKVYALANQKGGVGKTTTAVNLGAYLATSGQQVLLIDMDPQANATSSLGIDRTQLDASIYDVLVNSTPLPQIVLSCASLSLDIAPSSLALAGAEVEMVSMLAREHLLRKALISVAEAYDYLLIDCPPSLGLLTINALTAASDGVIIPVQCEYLALEGLSKLLHTIQLVRDNLNPRLTVRGLLLTMFDSRTNLSHQIEKEVRDHFGDRVFATVIPRNVRLGEAPSYGQSILTYAPHSQGALAYKALAEELTRADLARP